MHTRHERHAADPDRQPGHAGRTERLVGKEADAQENHEDGNRALRDCGDARVDVCLAPRDESHREGGIDEPQKETSTPRGSQLGDGVSRANADRQVAEQHGTRYEEADVDHRRGRNVFDGNLDEEV
jgi:hypothetical protein